MVRRRRLAGFRGDGSTQPFAQVRQARSRSPASGEARVVWPPFTTSTAIAIWGLSYGAKPMNHEWGELPGSSSAVPDFPATVRPGTAAPKVYFLPRLPLTASFIAAPISDATPRL